jgi:hypothetical protein
MSRMSFVLSLTVMTFLLGTTVAEDESLLPNGQFSDELDGWVYRPGGETQVSLVDGTDEQGTVVELHPDGKLLGVETERLTIGEELAEDQAYEVLAQLKHDGLESGVFAFSMYCFDEDGKSLKQISFYGLSAKSKPHDWKQLRGTFGPGSQNPLPEGTKSICIRFSFYEKSGDCRGGVTIDDVVLRPYDPPLHEGWPREIVARVDDLEVRFESRSFWSLYRIDYRGTRLGLDRWGSHYGSVANFPGVGFVGTGHTENEDEQIVDLELFVDGELVEEPEASLTCEEIRLVKESRIRDLVLNSEIRVCDDRIFEEVLLKAEKATPLNLFYHFMHPWTDTATEYMAETLDGPRIDGFFDGDRQQKIDQATRWSAIYDGPSGKGVVTYVLDAPQDDDWRTRYWDVPDRYRKHYLATFIGRTIPEDREFRYRVVTVPFESEADGWKAEAVRVAKSCEHLD